MTKITSGADIVFLFGSGASTPPLTTQQGLVQGLLTAAVSPRIRPAKRYLKHAFRGLTGSASSDGLRFEDIVGPLEIAESEEYWFHFGGQDTDKALITNKKVLDSLDSWLAMSLDPQTLPKPPSKRSTASEKMAFETLYAPSETSPLAYSRLLHLLEKTELLSGSAFLSMNYDILFDRALLSAATKAPDYWIDHFHDVPLTDQTSKILLLKLHGSLNWRSCDTCHVLRNLGSRVAWPGERCVDCGADTARPMLIRPTLLKDFRNRVWRDVWRKAGHALAAASKWIFIGYSLPMADVWVLRLLAQSAWSGTVKPADRRITVVNTDADVRKRFGFLFPQIDFHQLDFSSWVEDRRKQGSII